MVTGKYVKTKFCFCSQIAFQVEFRGARDSGVVINDVTLVPGACPRQGKIMNIY